MLFTVLLFPCSIIFFAALSEKLNKQFFTAVFLGMVSGFVYAVLLRIFMRPSLLFFSFKKSFTYDFVSLIALPFGFCFFCDFWASKFNISDFFKQTSVFCAAFFSIFSPFWATQFSTESSIFALIIRPFFYFCILLSIHIFIATNGKSIAVKGRANFMTAFFLAVQMALLALFNTAYSLKFPNLVVFFIVCSFFACLVLQTITAGIASVLISHVKNKGESA